MCATVILALIIWAALMLNRKEYALLYTGLNASETTTVVQYLNEHQVDYQVSGDKILVPKGREMQIQATWPRGATSPPASITISIPSTSTAFPPTPSGLRPSALPPFRSWRPPSA